MPHSASVRLSFAAVVPVSVTRRAFRCHAPSAHSPSNAGSAASVDLAETLTQRAGTGGAASAGARVAFQLNRKPRCSAQVWPLAMSPFTHTAVW